MYNPSVSSLLYLKNFHNNTAAVSLLVQRKNPHPLGRIVIEWEEKEEI